MKQCPNCKTLYTDETLVFCLADGARLESLTGKEETVLFPSEETVSFHRSPVRVDVPEGSGPQSVPTHIAPPFQPPPAQISQPRSSNSALIGILVVLLLLVIAGFAGFAAYVFFTPQTPADSGNNSPSTTVANTLAAQNTVAEKEDSQELKDKLANLEMQLANQQKQANSTGTLPTPPKQSGDTARVNSPGDGFLALRSEPSADAGFRITKIPHGSSVRVFGCGDYSNVGKTRGRWCHVSFGGQTGWAFDAFLSF